MLSACIGLALLLTSGTVLAVCGILLTEVSMDDELRVFLLVLLCIALAPD